MANEDKGPVDTKLVRRLASILKESGLSEIEVEVGGLRLRVVKAGEPAAQVTYAALPAPAPAASAPLAAPAPAPAASAPAPAPAAEPVGEMVKSPMVGTVYLQPAPGAAPFVKAGARVTAGQTLVLVEAMKTMNPIPAPRDGVVLEILVEDGRPVEYGEPLVVLE